MLRGCQMGESSLSLSGLSYNPLSSKTSEATVEPDTLFSSGARHLVEPSLFFGSPNEVSFLYNKTCWHYMSGCPMSNLGLIGKYEEII